MVGGNNPNKRELPIEFGNIDYLLTIHSLYGFHGSTPAQTFVQVFLLANLKLASLVLYASESPRELLKQTMGPC